MTESRESSQVTMAMLENEGKVFVVPIWFAKVVSAVFGVAIVFHISWASWMTVSMYNVNTKIALNDQQGQKIVKLEEEFDRLKDKVIDHIADPSIHTTTSLRVTTLETRFNLLEQRIQASSKAP